MNRASEAFREQSPYYQADFPPAEFAARRRRIGEAIGPGAIAVLRGEAGSGASEVFRQSNEFYYLCGVETPHSYLTVEGDNGRSALYLSAQDPKQERSEGPTLHVGHPDLARNLTGVDSVRPLATLAEDLKSATHLFTLLKPSEGRQAYRDTLLHARHQASDDPWDRRLPSEEHFSARLRTMFPQIPLSDLTPILDRLRLVKSPLEIHVMRKAGRLSALAVLAAMRETRPGLHEYHLAAIGDFVFRANGSQGAGYRPIVAAGHNAWNAHYYRNQSELRNGDWVLMDYAPDCGYYTSDIGRLWPVNGRYAPWQRELYGFMVNYHQTLLRLIRPGVTAGQIMDEAARTMAPIVQSTCWSKPSYARAAQKVLGFRGHLSHCVGMAVHDPGDYHDAPLLPGIVFAVDPQMWVREEQLYVRVEDTVVVTPDGIENLTRLAPLALDDVERTMRDPSLTPLPLDEEIIASSGNIQGKGMLP